MVLGEVSIGLRESTAGVGLLLYMLRFFSLFLFSSWSFLVCFLVWNDARGLSNTKFTIKFPTKKKKKTGKENYKN